MEGVVAAQSDTTAYHTQHERHKRKQNQTEDTKAVISGGPENSLGGKRPEYAMIPPRKRIKIMEKCKEKGEIKAGR